MSELIEETKDEAKAERYPIFQCSEAAKKLCIEGSFGVLPAGECAHNAKYPFAKMNVGESFAISFDALEVGTIESMRNRVSQYFKKTGKKFKVIIHKELFVVEIARIA